MADYFDGKTPDTITWDELHRMEQGLTRTFIPRAEVPEVYNTGKMQQLKQQQQTGGRIYNRSVDCE